jgi:hypothetical protein
VQECHASVWEDPQLFLCGHGSTTTNPLPKWQKALLHEPPFGDLHGHPYGKILLDIDWSTGGFQSPHLLPSCSHLDGRYILLE